MAIDVEAEKSRTIRDMFGAIARRYDLLNHVLSANLDRRWRQVCLQEVRLRNTALHPLILDVGCGTGDLSLVFSRLGSVFGCDFCHPMLSIGKKKAAGNDRHQQVFLLEADALMLPFGPASFDIVVSAFVMRNLASIEHGLREMRRVLRPGGILGILEFGMPRMALLASFYRFYFMKVLPKLGKIISGVEGPYSYLPASVQKFPRVEELKNLIESAGYENVHYRLLTGGIAVLLVGTAGRN